MLKHFSIFNKIKIHNYMFKVSIMCKKYIANSWQKTID